MGNEFESVLAEFKANERAEDIIPILSDEGAQKLVVAWPKIIIRHKEGKKPVPGTVNEKWNWLWEQVDFSERELAYSEVMALCDILNGHMATSADIRYGGNMLAAEIADGCALDGLGEKWQIDGKALAAKLKGLTDPQAWWVAHQARVWWYAVSSGDGAPEEEFTRKLFRVGKE